MFNLIVKASAYKGGPEIAKEVRNFPSNLAEAVERYGEDKVFAHFVRNIVIEFQGTMRADYKAPRIPGTRTKGGSALSQVSAARESE